MPQAAHSPLWLTLARLPGLPGRIAHGLLDRFGSIAALFAAPQDDVEAAIADTAAEAGRRLDAREAAQALAAGPRAAEWARDLAWLEEPAHHLVTWLDPDYPPLLREIADPPLVLYVEGRRDVLARPQLAIVGSRNPTPLGRYDAAAFARALCDAGLAITSGLALGIDAAAHRAALEAGGTTIAVAGTGLDCVYPPGNRELARAIAERGALVSEFPIGTPPRPAHFPIRNRLISGLSLGVLVVEAAEQSGSLITARLAAEQGREVFALPGSIHSPLARGCHRLIRQGAKLVETAADVLEELGPLAAVSADARLAASAPDETLTPDERAVLDNLGYEPMSVDALVERSGLTPDTVSSILLQLELRGVVLVGPGGYQRAPRDGGR
ncbi:MAG TPA: DNA-processing protein DprA [Burkholderiales bacterium]